MKYVCSHYHREENITIRHAKCACGGLWQLNYRPPAFTADDIDRAKWSQFRYHRYMALNGDAWRAVSMGEGMTPVIRFDGDVLLKMDYLMPTLSFKDRGAQLSSSPTAAEVGGDYCHDRSFHRFVVVVVHVLKKVRAEVRDHNDDDAGKIMHTL